jgi:hypothetical protein
MVVDLIRESARRLASLQGFATWLAGEQPSTGDMAVVNNSFVFRDVKTVKSDRFIAFSELSQTRPEAHVVKAPRQNLDFKRFSGAGLSQLEVLDIESAVEEEIQRVGFLVFLLIGEVRDTVTLEEPVGHQDMDRIIWDPSAGTPTVDNGVVTTGQVHDEEPVWRAVAASFSGQGVEVSDGLRDAVGTAMDKLQERAEAVVVIPSSPDVSDAGILDSILVVIREQRDQYSEALTRLDAATGQDISALNEVLRIAYNFASDATGILRLIVSICDLKPLVMWGTIAEHYALSEAFRALPWTRSKNKPTLKNYQGNIGDARNSAFHNLFPFRKTLRVELPTDAIGDPSLTIFSEHSKKSANELTYRDKELVDVLTEFTRARDRQVPSGFWQRNLDVMDRTIELFEATNRFVKELHKAKSSDV